MDGEGDVSPETGVDETEEGVKVEDRPSTSIDVADDAELDYEAFDDDDGLHNHEPKAALNSSSGSKNDKEYKDTADEKSTQDPDAETEKAPDEDEELEEGEVSDEDEEARKERLKPPPVCRFFSKGQCTWGSSCRFIHPGVLDTGRYSMFAQPRPILPGAEDAAPAEEGNLGKDGSNEDANSSSTARPPRPETAWERGLRQAKEMRKKSQQRKETDVEYEEKRANMSLTQAELDKENDYFMRQASPLHEGDETFGEDLEDIVGYRGGVGEDYHQFEGVRRRVAPPPPTDFARSSAPMRRYPPLERYSPGEPKGRRPRPPPPEGGYEGRRGDEWADPWMRADVGPRREQGSPGRESEDVRRRRPLRRRSYSSGSSRSSSSSSERVRRRRRRGGRRRSSSRSSHSSRSSRSGSRSRSRRSSKSSTPDDIPRRGQPYKSPPPKGGSSDSRNQAPLQKRLGALASSSSSSGLLKNIKKEPEDRPARSSKESGNPNLVPLGKPKAQASRRRRRSSSDSSRSPSASPPRRRAKRDKSSTPPRRLTSLKTSGSSATQNKINMPAVPPVVSNKPNPPPPSKSPPPPSKQIKMTLKSSISTKPANKVVLEKLGMEDIPVKRKASESENTVREKRKSNDEKSKKSSSSSKKDKKEREDKKSAADRREELLKQLKAVENAIAKKRTKISR